MTGYFRPFGLEPQPDLLAHIEDLNYDLDQVIAIPEDRARAVVSALGWPQGPGLRVLAAKLDPSSASIIHRDLDRATDQRIYWALNVPVKNCEQTFMEWFTGGTHMPMPPVQPTGLFRGYDYAVNPGDAVLAGTSEGCITAYVAANSIWHRVVNRSTEVSWCVSVRYYPLSFVPFKEAAAFTPWLRDIVIKKGT